MDPFEHASFDLDDDVSFQSAYEMIRSSKCRNFAVYFNHTDASGTTNLDLDHLKKWEHNRKAQQGTRWLHFWVDEDQRPLIAYLANKYDVSYRLLSFLCPNGLSSEHNSKTKVFQDTPSTNSTPQSISDFDDVEKRAAVRIQSKEVGPHDVTNLLECIGVADVVDRLWHFCSIDWGHRYVYMGINVLSSVPGLHPFSLDQPAGQRLWTSLLFCDDGTVISTCERPPLHNDDQLNLAANKAARRHISNIFRHLSRAHAACSLKTSDLTSVTIRSDISSVEASETKKFNVMEASSLLYYYIFDDWMTTYALIARIEHPYREKLERIRHDMTKQPDVALLEKLHLIGRQLTVLKQIYQSYAQVISRLLHRHRVISKAIGSPILSRVDSSPMSGQPFHSQHFVHQDHDIDYSAIASLERESEKTPSPLITSLTSTGVHLNVSAIMRFERLLDRIHLYALNEIEQCENEKESLVFMIFNLLTLSESHTIEKLTRTTIILAKATILFLPVSLLTAYFSIQVGNINDLYSLRTYWTSFGVIAVLSIVFIVLFGMKTKTVEKNKLYEDMRRILRQNLSSTRFGNK